jgi:competence ComEA-like helix-hairpin-helix protein
MNTKIACILFTAVSLAFAIAADEDGNDLPNGPGKDLVAKVCIDCHTAATFRKMRLNEDEWTDKVGDMVDRGAKADDKQQAEIVSYLVRNFGKGAKVNMNTAPHTELIVVLGFTVDESKALVAYRTDHGAFQQWSDLTRVPGLDVKKVETQKEKMVF